MARQERASQEGDDDKLEEAEREKIVEQKSKRASQE